MCIKLIEKNIKDRQKKLQERNDKMEELATPTMIHNPWWRQGMTPEEYDKEREYYFSNFDTLVVNGKYVPLWKQKAE